MRGGEGNKKEGRAAEAIKMLAEKWKKTAKRMPPFAISFLFFIGRFRATLR